MIARFPHESRLSRRRALGVAALAPAAMAGIAPILDQAQEDVPESTPVDTTPSPEIVNLVQYIHPEKTFFWVPGFADDTVRAGLYGLDVAAYVAVKADFAAAARGAASALLAD